MSKSIRALSSRSFEAIKALKRDYAWAIDLSICVFPQEGLTNDPGAEELLVAALRDGGEAIGGCPYMDTDPNAHLEKVFNLAQQFDVDVDLHLDFDLDPSWWHLEEVCRQTERRNYHGRVAIGHATKLSALPPDRLKAATARLAKAGVAVTVLPATDLYLMGRDATHNTPRGLTIAHRLVENGVVCSVATNNVLNPFTPFGDASLLRMANFYANVAQAGIGEFDACLDLVTDLPARLMNLRDYGIAPGNPADLIILDTDTGTNAIAELPDVLMGSKTGVRYSSGRARHPTDCLSGNRIDAPAIPLLLSVNENNNRGRKSWPNRPTSEASKRSPATPAGATITSSRS